MRKNANTENQKALHSQFVMNSRPVYEMMQAQNLQEQAEASDYEEEEEEEEDGMARPQAKKKAGGLFSGFGFGKSAPAKKMKASKKSDAYSAQLYQASKMSKGSYMKK